MTAASLVQAIDIGSATLPNSAAPGAVWLSPANLQSRRFPRYRRLYGADFIEAPQVLASRDRACGLAAYEMTSLGLLSASYGDPRTVGVEVTMHFGSGT